MNGLEQGCQMLILSPWLPRANYSLFSEPATLLDSLQVLDSIMQTAKNKGEFRSENYEFHKIRKS